MSNFIDEAKKKYEKLKKNQESQRFKLIMGRMVASKLFRPHQDIKPFYGKIKIQDALWAGSIESRITEVLPALVLKRPSLFEGLEDCPADLVKILHDIKKNQATETFRGVPPKNYLQWIPLAGHKGISPTYLKSFRFHQEDLESLKVIKTHGFSEVEAVREGLRILKKQLENEKKTASV
ncbi:MAG: hypothetical protein KA436_06385 [Oligoflexales bacterium]|nr:hypothetical protein [Oligoflexales bacterium]